jgi:hypothetical protein
MLSDGKTQFTARNTTPNLVFIDYNRFFSKFVNFTGLMELYYKSESNPMNKLNLNDLGKFKGSPPK